MNKLEFKVQGSTPAPYDVSFTKNGEHLFCVCNCQAGINGTYCKHRERILRGDLEGIVSDNLADVKIVQSWLPGTTLDKAYKDYELALEEFNVADKKRKKALKVIGYVMNPK